MHGGGNAEMHADHASEACDFMLLAEDLQEHVLRHIGDSSDRHALKATCKQLRSLANAASTALHFSGACAAAMRHVAQHAERWSGLKHLNIATARVDDAALEELLVSVARHCPCLAELRATLPAPNISPLLGACLAAQLRGHLSRLSSLTLCCGFDCVPLLLDPLGRLMALTALHLQLPIDGASKAWLPPSLTRLSLSGGRALAGASCGAAWMRAVGGCSRLEELELMHLGVEDLGGPQDYLWALCAALEPLTSLKSLTGVLQTHGPPPHHLPAARLLSTHPRLQRLVLYTLMLEPGITDGELVPAVGGSWREAAESAPDCLEELAFCCTRDQESASHATSMMSAASAGAGHVGGVAAAAARHAPPRPLPRLHTLHATADEQDAYPLDLERAAPALRCAVFGCANSHAPVVLPPLGAISGLMHLERLTLASGEWGAHLPGRFRQLCRSSALRELELYDLRRCHTDDASGGPEGHDAFMDEPDPLSIREVLEAVLSAPALARLMVSAPRRALPQLPVKERGAFTRVMLRRVREFVVCDARQQPCLLPQVVVPCCGL